MTYLQIAPGIKVGQVMSMLLEHRIDNGPYSEEEAFALAKEWAIEHVLIDG